MLIKLVRIKMNLIKEQDYLIMMVINKIDYY